MKVADPHWYHAHLVELTEVGRLRVKTVVNSSGLGPDARLRDLSEHFSDLLELAAIRERHLLGNSREPLQEAIELSETCAEIWLENEWDSNANAAPFRFGFAGLLSLLIHKKISANLSTLILDVSNCGADQTAYQIGYVDAGLLDLVKTGTVNPAWRELLREYSRRFRRNNLELSMACYESILLACNENDVDGTKRSVKQAEELYQQRVKFTGNCPEFAPWEGTDAGNYLFIDLRLAAVLGCSCCKHVEVDTTHRIRTFELD